MIWDMDMDMDYLFITPTYDHKIYDHDHGSVQNYTTLHYSMNEDEDCTWTRYKARTRNTEELIYLSTYLSVICLPTYPTPPPPQLRST